MFLRGLVDNVRSGPTGMEVVKVHAVARIMLNNWIPNIQASWVKEGSRMSQLLLTAGVNDLGGTPDQREHLHLGPAPSTAN